MRRFSMAIAGAAALCFSQWCAAQDDFPSRPVKMIVPYPAGGGGDILARALGDAFTKATGQAMVIENRAGASGMVGTTACKSAPADGYTYCLPISDVMSINPHVFKKVAYDPEKDFAIVAPVATVVGVLAVNSSVPVHNLKELVAYSQANKTKANWATWGVGSSAHLLMAQLNSGMGASLTDVPYPGIPQMIQAMLSGDAIGAMMLYGPLAQHIDSGKLRPLAVLGDQRFPPLPNVPTANEQGLNFSPTLFYGVFAPAATNAAIVEKMNRLVTQAAQDPAVQKTMALQGFTPLTEPRAAFAQRLSKDRQAWGTVAKRLNLQLD